MGRRVTRGSDVSSARVCHPLDWPWGVGGRGWIGPDGLWELAEPLLQAARVRPQGGGVAHTDEEAVFAAGLSSAPVRSLGSAASEGSPASEREGLGSEPRGPDSLLHLDYAPPGARPVEYLREDLRLWFPVHTFGNRSGWQASLPAFASRFSTHPSNVVRHIRSVARQLTRPWPHGDHGGIAPAVDGACDGRCGWRPAMPTSVVSAFSVQEARTGSAHVGSVVKKTSVASRGAVARAMGGGLNAVSLPGF